jgi:hypothetical protein
MILDGDFGYFSALAKFGISFKWCLTKCVSDGPKWNRLWWVLDRLQEYGMYFERRVLIYGT